MHGAAESKEDFGDFADAKFTKVAPRIFIAAVRGRQVIRFDESARLRHFYLAKEYIPAKINKIIHEHR